MIKITVRQQNKKIVYLRVSGHAGSATEGHDLVCAAVSAVTVGCLNNLTDIQNYHVIMEKGLVEIEEKRSGSEHDQIVLETLLTALKTIAENNSDYVKVN